MCAPPLQFVLVVLLFHGCVFVEERSHFEKQLLRHAFLCLLVTLTTHLGTALYMLYLIYAHTADDDKPREVGPCMLPHARMRTRTHTHTHTHTHARTRAARHAST